jgi:hypothetical protein
MVSPKIAVGAVTLIAAATLVTMPLAALSMRECSVAYKDARGAGTLGGMSWREFRKARCGAGTATRSSTRPKTRAQTGATTGSPSAARPQSGLVPGGSAYLPGGRAVFPTAIAPRYSDETRARARRQTCLDQYRRNKPGNANGGLKWVQKGGGYYSECSRRLKAGWKP